MGWLAVALHAVLLAVAAPALDGALRWAAARWHGQPAPAVQQPVRDLVRLWRKQAAAPAGASFVFGAAPAVSLAAASVAGLLTPSFTSGMGTAGAMDLIVVAGLLALSQAVLALAGHDAGSAPAAFASDRAMAVRVTAAPALLLVALALTALSGGTNLDAAAAAVRDGGGGAKIVGALAGAALLLAAAGERSAALPGFSGRQRALAVLAGQIRFAVWLSLVAAVAAPFGLAAAGSGPDAWLLGAACWVLKLGVLGAAVTWLGAARLHPAGASLLALTAVMLGSVQGAA